MAFALSTKSTLTESLGLVLTGEVDQLFAAGAGSTGTDERVHETRKSIKRLRALMRLYRGALAHSLYEREDSVLGRLAQSLGRARDAAALRETLDRLVLAAPADARARLSDHLRELERALIDTSETPKDVDATLALVHDGLGALRARASEWTVERRGWAIIAPGLERTYASGRHALSRARHRPTERRLHRLRTWVKRHQHQLTLLEPLWPEPIKAFRQEAQRLGELLGHDHDLHLLESRLERLAASPELVPLETPLRAASEGSHAALQREAFELAARLYAEPPTRFTARHREYFDAWA